MACASCSERVWTALDVGYLIRAWHFNPLSGFGRSPRREKMAGWRDSNPSCIGDSCFIQSLLLGLRNFGRREIDA
jgi:hypothetical protein